MRPENIENIRRNFPQGARVELLEMDDPHAPAAGTQGSVYGVDDIGDILVNWDNGCSLNVVYGKDRIRRLN